jgi:hypothetical protein
MMDNRKVAAILFPAGYALDNRRFHFEKERLRIVHHGEQEAIA